MGWGPWPSVLCLTGVVRSSDYPRIDSGTGLVTVIVTGVCWPDVCIEWAPPVPAVNWVTNFSSKCVVPERVVYDASSLGAEDSGFDL